MSRNRIAIVGRFRSGKNTFADYITDNFGHVQFAFGNGITEVINQYFPEAFANGKPRKHYQVIGQSFRELDENIWVNKALEELETHWNTFGDYPVIITDLRQLNEYKVMKSLGFTVIKVEAEEEVRLKRIAAAGDTCTPDQLNHDTELQADACPCDYLVTNNDSLEALYQQADFIMNELMGEK